MSGFITGFFDIGFLLYEGIDWSTKQQSIDNDRLLVVVNLFFNADGEEIIRIISAREAKLFDLGLKVFSTEMCSKKIIETLKFK